jgi:hypothetical protein
MFIVTKKDSRSGALIGLAYNCAVCIFLFSGGALWGALLPSSVTRRACIRFDDITPEGRMSQHLVGN